MLITSIRILLLFLLPSPNISSADLENFDEKGLKNIKNVKTFAGPMGMGLAKSLEYNDKKVCFYNTVDGQQKLILDKIELKCPKFLD